MDAVDPEHRKLIRKVAREAAYNGSNAELWHEWRATVVRTGVPMPTAVALLNREAQRWYARFCFSEGFRGEGLHAYEMLLEGNDEARWVYEGEAEQYLSAVREVRGAAGVIGAFEAFARIQADGFYYSAGVAEAEAESGRAQAALARMEQIVTRYHTDGQLHADLARHAAAVDHDEQARRHLVAAAKRGAVAETPNDDLRRLGVNSEMLRGIAAEHAVKDQEALLADFIRQPGLTLLPADDSDTDADAPHVYGGDGRFELPACPGCGRAVLLLAAIDTAAAAVREPTLVALAASLPRLPILHCDNCQLMFSLPDYRVSEDAQRIEVFNTMPLKKDGATFDSDKHPIAQRAKLVVPEVLPLEPGGDPWLPGDHLDRQRDCGPQIGGRPRPINAPRRRFCPQCDAEQTFYAAVCETGAFATNIIVNPNGYCYWFACPACRIVSTDLDNT